MGHRDRYGRQAVVTVTVTGSLSARLASPEPGPLATQGTPLGICNGMPKTPSAIAKLLRVRRLPFLGLTGTGLDDFDGRLIAAALENARPRVSMEPERLDLTQIDFVTAIRAPLLAAGEKAGVRVLLSNPDGPELRLP